MAMPVHNSCSVAAYDGQTDTPLVPVLCCGTAECDKNINS